MNKNNNNNNNNNNIWHEPQRENKYRLTSTQKEDCPYAKFDLRHHCTLFRWPRYKDHMIWIFLLI